MNKATWEELEPDEWLRLHNSAEVITASEVATILGYNPWESAYTLFHRKMGHTPPVLTTIPMRVGHALEDLIAKLYEEETGRHTIDPGPFTVVRHADYPWFFATLDRLDDTDRYVETKSAGQHAKSDWIDSKGPIHYQLQNQSQLICGQEEKGALAGLIANREFITHDFELNTRLAKAIEKAVVEFKDRLETNSPPPVDGTDSTTETLKALHPKDNGKEVYDDDATAWIAERKELKDKQAHLKRDLTRVENHIKNLIGDNTGLWADGYHMTYKHQSKDAYSVKASESRVLRMGK